MFAVACESSKLDERVRFSPPAPSMKGAVMKKLLFSVTASDCRWDYFRGSGKGGQKKNKTDNCARCTHVASGAVGKSEDGRSKDHNRKTAFERMANTSEFKAWHRMEIARRTGETTKIEDAVREAMREVNIRTEVKDDNGLWSEVKEIKE